MAVSTERQIAQIDAILRTWLADPAITLICGDWARGSIMELLPEGRATLTGPRYEEPFAGLRELHLAGQGHHVHLDLAQFAHAVYTVAPSVCYGFRPSFELHFMRGDDDPGFALAVAVRDPWRAQALVRARAVSYFQRVLSHQVEFAEVVRFRATTRGRDQGTAWPTVLSCLHDAAGNSSDAAEEPLADGPNALMAAVRGLTTASTDG